MDSTTDDNLESREIGPADYPGLLRHMPCPPAHVYIRGQFPPDTYTYITIVGSRKHTDYGKEACRMLIKSLTSLPIVIVSGLAFGIDSIAHKTALECGLKTIAIPGSGIDEKSLYPASHLNLAREILANGGGLLSPFPDGTLANNWTFPTRNAIMAGISKATLIIEAEIKSGTLITSKHATDFSRDVFAVPGSIFSKQSDGPHMLIRNGATPIRNGDDLREALGFPFEKSDTVINKRFEFYKDELSKEELRLINIIENKSRSKEELFTEFGGAINDFNSIVSILEIKELIKEQNGHLILA